MKIQDQRYFNYQKQVNIKLKSFNIYQGYIIYNIYYFKKYIINSILKKLFL